MEIKTDGQWIVLIFSLIILNAGLARALKVGELLAFMIMGMVVVNRCQHQETIFRIPERYTEDMVFLIFFLLSGLHLEIWSVPQASLLIAVFIVLRTLGKFLGTWAGARSVHADPKIRKYTAGGLLPQAGIVIGLVLKLYENPEFHAISHLLLTVMMGATVIHELVGPLAARHSLRAAGETREEADID